MKNPAEPKTDKIKLIPRITLALNKYKITPKLPKNNPLTRAENNERTR
jgi:hypothetical protein